MFFIVYIVKQKVISCEYHRITSVRLWCVYFGVSVRTAVCLASDYNFDTPIHLDPRRLVRQTAFCDPQIPQYSAALENSFPANQLRLEVNRGVPSLNSKAEQNGGNRKK